MLLQLNINNFALIEKLTISFEKGFNVLTGETGTGKSILIDAIGFVLGSKSNKSFIRTGSDKTFVEAIFSIKNPKTKEILKELEIEYDDVLIVRRETFKSGKSIAKVNNTSILISKLKLIAETLLDIHGQHENQNLLNAAKHIFYLDYFGENNLKELFEIYKEKHQIFLEITNKLNSLCGDKGEREKLIDFLKYQINEIEKADLKIGEDIELEKKFKILSNSENINKVLSECYSILYEEINDKKSVFDNLAYVIKQLDSVSEHSSKIEDIANNIRDCYYNVEQNISDIRNIRDNITYDQKELEYINSRIYSIDNYKSKYGNTIKEILQYKEKISKQYNELVNSSEIIEKLNNKKNSITNEMLEISKKLHNERVKIANILQKKVRNELNYIGLEKSVFSIDVNYNKEFLNQRGADKVQFMIATNPGEASQPLDKVVSGGELSRIMLALKTVFVDKDNIPSVIFDEVDTGISGRVAQSVAEKMYIISQKHQVFCVTHLPQIASMSDSHYLVSKNVNSGKTYTMINVLNKREKQLEIARMIGTSEVTKLTLEHSNEFIKLADDKKKELNLNKRIN